VIGSRFHYAVKYDLLVKDGVIQPDSEVWMNFIYRSRKVSSWRLPHDEWFSPNPIPELPSKGIEDMQLLGLDEFEDEAGKR
jgi:hypothetical protein